MVTVSVLSPNNLIAQIVAQVYESKLKSHFQIEIVCSEFDRFEPDQHSVVVVDRRLIEFIPGIYERGVDSEMVLVPFDETDFEEIHQSIAQIARFPRNPRGPQAFKKEEFRSSLRSVS